MKDSRAAHIYFVSFGDEQFNVTKVHESGQCGTKDRHVGRDSTSKMQNNYQSRVIIVFRCVATDIDHGVLLLWKYLALDAASAAAAAAAASSTQNCHSLFKVVYLLCIRIAI